MRGRAHSRPGVAVRAWALGALLAVLGALSAPPPAAAGEGVPARVVSMDFCADQYVLALADRAQVAALSPDADRAFSFYRERAGGLPKTAGTIAEVLYLSPDLVVQTGFSTARTRGLLERGGAQMLTTRFGLGPEIMYENLALLGAALGRQTRAAKMIADYRARVEALEVLVPIPLRAVYLTPSGYTAGTGTFVEAILRLAGLESYAERRGLAGWQPLPLEDLVRDPPDAFVTSFFDTNLAMQSPWSLARHNYLARLLREKPTVDLPARYIACDGFLQVEAAERIRAAFEGVGK